MDLLSVDVLTLIGTILAITIVVAVIAYKRNAEKKRNKSKN